MLFVSFFKFRSKDLGYLPSETVYLLRKAFWTEDQDFLTSSLWLPMAQGHSSAPSSGTVLPGGDLLVWDPRPTAPTGAPSGAGGGRALWPGGCWPWEPSAWLNSSPFQFPWLAETSCPPLWMLRSPRSPSTLTSPKPHSSHLLCRLPKLLILRLGAMWEGVSCESGVPFHSPNTPP